MQVESGVMSRKPLVSSIMIFLDAEKFIQEAIESIFAQTYNNWELLLVDDGSTDGSTEVALRYAREHPEKVRYLEHDNHQNRGMSASRNLGISNAKGEFIAFLDADDVWMPHKLEQQVAIMESHPEVGMVYGSTQYWYGWTGNPEDSQCDYRDLVEERCGVEPNNVIEPPRLLDIFLVYENAVPCICSILMRRELVENVGGTEDRFQGQYEDQVLLVKVGLQAPVYVAGECWAKYRRHPDSSWWNAQMTGQQYSTRLFFLEWLEGYLLKLRIKDTKAWNALQAALQRCYDLTASVEILEVTRIETDSALLWGHFIDLPKPGTQVAG